MLCVSTEWDEYSFCGNFRRPDETDSRMCRSIIYIVKKRGDGYHHGDTARSLSTSPHVEDLETSRCISRRRRNDMRCDRK